MLRMTKIKSDAPSSIKFVATYALAAVARAWKFSASSVAATTGDEVWPLGMITERNSYIVNSRMVPWFPAGSLNLEKI